MIELRSQSGKIKCNLCNKKFYNLLLYCTFDICNDCHFKLTHEGRTPGEEDIIRLNRLDKCFNDIEKRLDILDG